MFFSKFLIFHKNNLIYIQNLDIDAINENQCIDEDIKKNFLNFTTSTLFNNTFNNNVFFLYNTRITLKI